MAKNVFEPLKSEKARAGASNVAKNAFINNFLQFFKVPPRAALCLYRETAKDKTRQRAESA